MNVWYLYLFVLWICGVTDGVKKIPPGSSEIEKSLLKLNRPKFKKQVNILIKKEAKSEGYDPIKSNFDIAHIVPFEKIREMAIKYGNKELDEKNMIEFIEELAKPHKDAAYFNNLNKTLQEEIVDLSSTYKDKSLENLKEISKLLKTNAKNPSPEIINNFKKLISSLNSMPSNLFPGDSSINRSIQNNLDPVYDVGGEHFSKQSKKFMDKYGIQPKFDTKKKKIAKSSDVKNKKSKG